MFDPKFFLATVTSNEDPDMRGRVRIRIMGIHTEITTKNDSLILGMEEKDLPLAQCMYPVTYTGTGGTCPPPSLQPGDWVFGVSLDGDSYQNLMVLGLAKAKFNAESLADGSINANDAFANVQKPLAPNEAAMAQQAKEEAEQKYAEKSAESRLANYNAERGPEYEKASSIASEWKPPSMSAASSYGVSTGNAVFNILTSLAGTPELGEFNQTSGLNLNPLYKSETATNVIEEGYYSYCHEYFNKNFPNESPILPTFAFKMGCGSVEDMLAAYGDPRNSSISYAQFCNNMQNDGMTEEADYFRKVVDELNKGKSNKTSLKDAKLTRYRNHQYVAADKIASKSLRVLGDAVFPTIRSTVTQSQHMLPYYSIEGNRAHEHIGVDLATGKEPVLAFAAGTVVSVKTTVAKDCNAVVILHNAGIKTLYLHMNDILVKKGQKVKAGQQIGTGGGAGAKGPNTHSVHLHFAVKKESRIVDPEKFLRKEIGFAVRTIETADHYRKGPLSSSDKTYRELRNARTSDSITWGF